MKFPLHSLPMRRSLENKGLINKKTLEKAREAPDPEDDPPIEPIQ